MQQHSEVTYDLWIASQMGKVGIDFHDWELESISSFLAIRYSNIHRSDGCDQMRWRLRANGGFTVWSYYVAIQGPPNISFPWKSI